MNNNEIEPKINKVKLYRIQNPNIQATPNGTTSHEDLIGKWFTPDLDSVLNYLRKSTQTFGPDGGPVQGAELIVVEVPENELSNLHVSEHEVASQMDVEGDNYIVEPDSEYQRTTIGLDEHIGDLAGKLGNFNNLMEAKIRIAALVQSLGEEAVNQSVN
jgi:hypothetical protein